MNNRKEVFTTKTTFDKDTGKIQITIDMKPKYDRLLKIAQRTKPWRSRLRILKRVTEAITGEKISFIGRIKGE